MLYQPNDVYFADIRLLIPKRVDDMVKLVVFDMAGTSIDEDNVVYKTLQQSIEQAGFPCTLDQVLAEGAGREKYQAIQQILQVFHHLEDDSICKTIFADFVIRLSAAYQHIQVKPMPDALELFHQLRNQNIKVVLNTGYNITTAQTLLHKLGWKEGVDYDALITASDVTNSRPAPDMIHLAFHKFKLTNGNEAIKVGDSIIDIEEGRNAGCRLCIGITTGAHTREQLLTAHPDAVIDHLFQLIPLLKLVD
jgi:phosphonatase-like hydrolase